MKITKTVCVIGAGSIGLLHIECYLQINGVKVIVVESNDNKRKTINGLVTNTCKSIEDIEDLKSVDLFDICLPTNLHGKYIKKIREFSTTNILCEKPLVSSIDEYKLLNDQRLFSKKPLVAFVERFNESYIELKRLISELKDTQLLVEFERFTYPPTTGHWLLDPEIGKSDILLDLGIHDIDLAIWIFGHDIKEVKILNKSRNKLEKSLSILFSSGNICEINCGWTLSKNNKKGINTKVKVTDLKSKNVAVILEDNLIKYSGATKVMSERIPNAYTKELTSALNLSNNNLDKEFPDIEEIETVMKVYHSALQQSGYRS